MSLSKERDKERKRQARLEKLNSSPPFQPNTTTILLNGTYVDVPVPQLDADGEIIPEL